MQYKKVKVKFLSLGIYYLFSLCGIEQKQEKWGDIVLHCNNLYLICSYF